jgi:hypothetical protein
MSTTDITYLNTPFHQKDEVKRLGARWDTVAKKWFLPAAGLCLFEYFFVKLKAWMHHLKLLLVCAKSMHFNP